MNQSITRRQALKNLATASLAGTALLAGQRSWGASSEKNSPGIQIGVCDWTMGKRGDPEAFPLAKSLGFQGVQVDLGDAASDLPVRKKEVQEAILAKSRETGIPIASLAIGALNDVPYKKDPRAEAWVADSIPAAEALGVRIILLAFFSEGDLRGDAEGVNTVVSRLKNIAPVAEKAGLIFGIESWLTAEEHVQIIDRVGSPAVKAYYDVGNSNHVKSDIYKEIRYLGKDRICEFHAKDYDDLYGKGSINFPEVRKAMEEIGYQGWMQVEGFQYPLGLEESLKYDASYLKNLFSGDS